MNGNGTATRKIQKVAITVTKLSVIIHPDKTDDFTDELERLCRKYSGENFVLDWREN